MSAYRCVACSRTFPGPVGECLCGSRKVQPVKDGLVNRAPAMLASELAALEPPVRVSIEPILDRALSMGSTWGFSILLSGGEGSGKSTLATSACSYFSYYHKLDALYASSEEDPSNVGDRMRRLDLYADRTYIMSDSMGEAIFTETKDRKLLIVDSVSGFSYRDQSCEFGPAAVALCKDVHRWAHANKAIAILICQANKDGDQVGPRALAHCVDATLTFWRGADTHMLVTGKNRRGRAPVSTHVVLDEKGMKLDA